LFSQLLDKVKNFNCNLVHTSIYDHSNYEEHKKLLIKKNFKLVQTNREYSCDIRDINIKKYYPLIKKLESEGIKFYDSKEEMKNSPNKFPNHYKKLEELIWTYSKDFPIPDGIKHTRMSFEQALKLQIDFEKNSYGAEVVAVKDNKYIGSTDITVYPKSEPHKVGLEVLVLLKNIEEKASLLQLKLKPLKNFLKKE